MRTLRYICFAFPFLIAGAVCTAMRVAIDRLKEHGAGELRFVCLLATQTGLAKFHAHHPEVRVWTASIDPELNDHGYILPGLGDAGDRLYGTR